MLACWCTSESGHCKASCQLTAKKLALVFSLFCCLLPNIQTVRVKGTFLKGKDPGVDVVR